MTQHSDLDAELRELKRTLQNLRKWSLPTGDVEARIAALEAARPATHIEGGGIAAARDVRISESAVAGRDLLDFRSATLNLFVQAKPERGAWFRHYLANLMAEYGRLPAEMFDNPDDESRLRLWRVYTTLDTMERAGSSGFWREVISRQPALRALNEHSRLVLLGGPGTGKTTFATFVALCMAGAMLRRTGDPGLDDLCQRLPEKLEDENGTPRLQLDLSLWTHGALLPVFARLREFVASAHFPRNGGTPTAQCLLDFVHSGPRSEMRLEETFYQSLVEYLTGEAGAGVLLVLDGLDEVPQAEGSRGPLRQVIEKFAEAYPECRVLVTSRPYAYVNEQWHLGGFARAELAPLTPAQVRLFAWRWYHAIEPADQLLAKQRAHTLSGAVLSDARLRALGEIPLLLAMMALVHRQDKGQLPRGRALLYERVTDLLLFRWNQPRNENDLAADLCLPLSAIRATLERLAFDVHDAEAPGAEQAALLPKGRLLEALDAASRDCAERRVPLPHIADYLSLRAGILLPEGNSAFRFPHRSFQEFLAACYLTDQTYASETVPPLVWKDPARWREVALLVAARMSKTRDALRVLIEELCPGDPPVMPNDHRWWGAPLAGLTLAETGEPGAHRMIDHVRCWLAALLDIGALPPLDRAEVGRILAALGDGRPGIGLRHDGLPDIAWCNVQAGAVTLGKRRFSVQPFKLAEFPVTYGHYQVFLNAKDGFHNDAWWDELARREQEPGEQRIKYDNHPAENVSWFDAVAFCRWLTARLRMAGDLREDEEVRLPTEWEWQQAATGGNPVNIYPWGPEYRSGDANLDETSVFGTVGPHYLGTTTAVGMYPAGASLVGALDMAGNVWEWCVNEYRTPKNVDLRGKAARALRGGSWDDDVVRGRCVFRDKLPPNIRSYYVGFRVACVHRTANIAVPS